MNDKALAQSRQSGGLVTPAQIEEHADLIKNSFGLGEATPTEFRWFLEQCKAVGLDPLRKQVFPILQWDNKERRKKLSIGTTIDGLRAIASRSGAYGGQLGPWWCGDDGKWVDVWLKDSHPSAAKVGVINRQMDHPVYRVARFDSFAQRNKDGGVRGGPWSEMPDIMLAKCAEAQALRAAFPESAGFYVAEESPGGHAPGGAYEPNAEPAQQQSKSVQMAARLNPSPPPPPAPAEQPDPPKESNRAAFFRRAVAAQAAIDECSFEDARRNLEQEITGAGYSKENPISEDEMAEIAQTKERLAASLEAADGEPDNEPAGDELYQ